MTHLRAFVKPQSFTFVPLHLHNFFPTLPPPHSAAPPSLPFPSLPSTSPSAPTPAPQFCPTVSDCRPTPFQKLYRSCSSAPLHTVPYSRRRFSPAAHPCTRVFATLDAILRHAPPIFLCLSRFRCLAHLVLVQYPPLSTVVTSLLPPSILPQFYTLGTLLPAQRNYQFTASHVNATSFHASSSTPHTSVITRCTHTSPRFPAANYSYCTTHIPFRNRHLSHNLSALRSYPINHVVNIFQHILKLRIHPSPFSFVPYEQVNHPPAPTEFRHHRNPDTPLASTPLASS